MVSGVSVPAKSCVPKIGIGSLGRGRGSSSTVVKGEGRAEVNTVAEDKIVLPIAGP